MRIFYIKKFSRITDPLTTGRLPGILESTSFFGAVTFRLLEHPLWSTTSDQPGLDTS